jgi:hypothetical protein
MGVDECLHAVATEARDGNRVRVNAIEIGAAGALVFGERPVDGLEKLLGTGW